MSAPCRYHVQPAQGWLNDPNGLVFHEGRWHVFFQHNPAAPRHGDIAWGHVSSPDLVRWVEHPVAFRPEPDGPDHGGCWSGVALRSRARIAAVYTGIRSGPADSTICLRYALDPALEEWSGPRVVGTEPSGIGLREMRDPFVFDWSGRRWALLGARLDDGPAVLLWSCDDLEAWHFERVWFTIEHPVVRTLARADTWECPQLVEVDGSWVLLVSLWKAGILDRVTYAVGSLVEDGGVPRFAPRSAGLVDEGTVLYAPQVLQDAPGGAPLMFGWIREAEALGPTVPSVAPDGSTSPFVGPDGPTSPFVGPDGPTSPFVGPDGPTISPDDSAVGCLSLPRRLALKDDRLISTVDPAVFALLGDAVDLTAEGLLPAQSMLRVASTPVTLAGAGIKVELPAHTDVWLDGEVLEAYPAGGVPRTFRDPGTLAWRLVDEWSDVQVRHVSTPPRQRPTLAF